MNPHGWVVGTDLLDQFVEAISTRHAVAIVTQDEVPSEITEQLRAKLEFENVRTILVNIPNSEREAKTLATIENISREIARAELSRSDAIVAIGGGVVSDVAGFAAASYHRGIAWYVFPTTLLAQVDASIGGKTGVDLPEGKNLVGSFWMPELVVADVSVLKRLPEDELRSGLGEVIKYALIGNGALLDILQTRSESIFACEVDVLSQVVEMCIVQKMEIVSQDPQELTGKRAILNYGHTFGHALEAAENYQIRHGYALSVGLVFAAELSHALSRVEQHVVDEHRELVERYGLPVKVPHPVSGQDLEMLMRRDKKADKTLTLMLAGESGIERVESPDPKALAAAFAAVGVE